jgi:hypothetical protein
VCSHCHPPADASVLRLLVPLQSSVTSAVPVLRMLPAGFPWGLTPWLRLPASHDTRMCGPDCRIGARFQAAAKNVSLLRCLDRLWGPSGRLRIAQRLWTAQRVYMYISMYVCIYIYIERERDRGSENPR